MVSKNDHTGDLIMSKKASKAYEDNYNKIFGDKNPMRRGRFIQDPETGNMVPANEFQRPEPKRSNLPTPMIQVFTPGRSPITGEWLETKRQMNEDMKRHGCREYEGFESEQKVANQWQAEQEKKFNKEMGEAMEKTAVQLRDKMTESAPVKPLNIFED